MARVPREEGLSYDSDTENEWTWVRRERIFSMEYASKPWQPVSELPLDRVSQVLEQSAPGVREG